MKARSNLNLQVKLVLTIESGIPSPTDLELPLVDEATPSHRNT